jgi:predicted RNA-binding Zn-ribbon protein involved in translation (DUF1610 family)
MAQALRFVCSKCSHAIEAWSDGNPYFIDEAGAKQYAYHPNHEQLARCIGNDSPHHCLSCGAEFKVDSRIPVTACPSCGASNIINSYRLGGCRCPYCKQGTFTEDPDFDCVS